MQVQKTTLYNYHKNLGAKFVSFAGYEMPIQYSEGIIKEHISTRTYAGFFDVSHMGQFYISGKNIEEALEKIIPTDLKGLKENQSKYSLVSSFSENVREILSRVSFLPSVAFPLLSSVLVSPFALFLLFRQQRAPRTGTPRQWESPRHPANSPAEKGETDVFFFLE